MTKLLYMKDCYLKEFDANVIRKGENFVILDQTAFYPLGGGQPSDQGSLNGSKVLEVRKDQGEIKHFVNKIPEGKEIHGILDWKRRYTFMRMHTAQHLLSAIILDKYGASTAGNQISFETSRIDFFPFKPSQEDITFVAKRFNELADKGIPVNIYFTTREEVLQTIDERRRNLFSRVPESVKEIRVIEIEGIDKVPCGGTHVRNTKEIGHINIIKTENKGKNVTRIVFGLEE
jgi:misacylated tRNA(Ala) deacylase